MNYLQKRWISVLLLGLLLLTTGCEQNPSRPSDIETAWRSVQSIPFSGYICGNENSQTLIQILLLGNPELELSETEVSRIYLSNSKTGETIPCKLSNILGGTASENWKLYTLSLYVEFPPIGVYWIDQIELTLNTGKSVLLNQQSIEIEVLPAVVADDLLSRRVRLNHGDYNLVTITYQNLSDHPVNVLGIDAGSSFAGIESVTIFENSTPVESTLIPPGEMREFVFELTPSEAAFQTVESQFILMLPKLQYETEAGSIVYVPAQNQATTVTPTLSYDYLDSLFLDSSS